MPHKHGTMQYKDGRMTTDEVVEEVRWFTECGVHPELIAHELHRSLYSLERLLRTKGEHALANPFSVVVKRLRSADAA